MMSVMSETGALDALLDAGGFDPALKPVLLALVAQEGAAQLEQFYADATRCNELFCLPRGRLPALVAQGHVRRVKHGESIQSKATYSVADLLRWHERQARSGAVAGQAQ